MTKEQEKAIEIVNNFIKIDFNNKNGWIGYYDSELKELQEGIKTVLSMLQEKDKEIEKYKYLYQKTLDNTIQADRENIKLKKQIDLMTEIFYKRFKAELLLEYGFESEEQLKQYFENKAKE